MESGNLSEIVNHIFTLPSRLLYHLFLKHDKKAWSQEILK